MFMSAGFFLSVSLISTAELKTFLFDQLISPVTRKNTVRKDLFLSFGIKTK